MRISGIKAVCKPAGTKGVRRALLLGQVHVTVGCGCAALSRGQGGIWAKPSAWRSKACVEGTPPDPGADVAAVSPLSACLAEGGVYVLRDGRAVRENERRIDRPHTVDLRDECMRACVRACVCACVRASQGAGGGARVHPTHVRWA